MTDVLDIKQMRDEVLRAKYLREIRESFEAVPPETRSALYAALEYLYYQPVAYQARIIEILLHQLGRIDDI